MSEARNHHYIPQCYLRGFSEGSGKKRKVVVAIVGTGEVFATNPRNVCGIRDFNRVDLPGVKPDGLESSFSAFETEVAEALRRISTSGKCDGDDRITILNLMAMLAVRSPQQRENWRQFYEQVAKNVMSLTVATKERWESQERQARAAGYLSEHHISYEDIKKFHEDEQYTVTLKREYQIGMEFEMFETVLPLLAKRNWMHYRTTEERGLFITADRPVVISFNEPEKVPALYRRSPGFGLKNTQVVFPVTKTDLLVGEFEGKEGMEDALPDLVASANTKMLLHAFEQAYMAKRSIPYLGLDFTMHRDPHFMKRHKDEALQMSQQRGNV